MDKSRLLLPLLFVGLAAAHAQNLPPLIVPRPPVVNVAPDALAKFTDGVTPAEIAASQAHLAEAEELVAKIADATLRAELSLGARLAGAGLRRASGQPVSAEEQTKFKQEYEAVWLRRSRPGGLTESVAGLFG